MDKLFLRTKRGDVPIDPSVAAKYDLKAGEETPFSHAKIVGADGSAPQGGAQSGQKEEGEKEGELMNDEISELENGVTLSQSEIIDFSQGTDSSNR